MTLHRTLLLLALAAVAPLHAQVHTIADGFVSACSGSMLDSGGEGASGYQDNENYTATICPDAPGTVIALQFVTFNLSTAGSAPGDVLFIYDGPDMSYPLIGQWSGADSPGIVSASSGNPSGCLTLVFTSNETGTGVFSSLISCYTPCQPPVAAATVGGDISAQVCQGEVVSFDASASTAAPGSAIVEYAWDFGDNTSAITTSPFAQHSYTTPGTYSAQVVVTDDQGCTSTSNVDLLVEVGGAPSFLGTVAQPPACVGATVNLVAQVSSASSDPWTFNPPTGLLIPDGTGIPFTTTIEVTGQEPDALIGSIDQVPTICVDLEHSYMGDLTLAITCPNGQSIAFHQQGGGSTYLGAANDSDAGTGPVIGECWTYCWSPTATLGTFVDCATSGPTPNVTQAGAPSNNALIAGTYSSMQPMDQLIGCPVEGTWTLAVTDSWALDNGWLCGWSLDLDPGATGPVPGTSALDSAFWSGPGVTTDPATPLVAQAAVTAPGVLAYTFTVTDNYGCTYDTTVTVTAPDVSLQALDGPTVISGPEAVVYIAQGVGADVEAILWSLPPGWSWADDPDTLDATAIVQPSPMSAPFQLCATAQGQGCSSASICLDVTGVEDATGEAATRVFPNPTNGLVQVMRPTATPTLLTVADATGRTVHQHPLQGPHTVLDLGHLGQGAYVLLWWEGARPHRHPVTLTR